MALRGERVVGVGQLLLLDEEFLAGGLPLLRCDDRRQLDCGPFLLQVRFFLPYPLRPHPSRKPNGRRSDQPARAHELVRAERRALPVGEDGDPDRVGGRRPWRVERRDDDHYGSAVRSRARGTRPARAASGSTTGWFRWTPGAKRTASRTAR